MLLPRGSLFTRHRLPSYPLVLPFFFEEQANAPCANWQRRRETCREPEFENDELENAALFPH